MAFPLHALESLALCSVRLSCKLTLFVCRWPFCLCRRCCQAYTPTSAPKGRPKLFTCIGEWIAQLASKRFKQGWLAGQLGAEGQAVPFGAAIMSAFSFSCCKQPSQPRDLTWSNPRLGLPWRANSKQKTEHLTLAG